MTRVMGLFLGALVALAPLGCKKEADPNARVRGSGVGGKAARKTPDFSQLKVGGTVRVEVEVGKPTSLELLGEDNLLPLVTTRVEGGTLVITPESVLKTSQPLVARITTPSLQGVELFAAATGFVRGVRRIISSCASPAPGRSR
jgi:hypothetical protein